MTLTISQLVDAVAQQNGLPRNKSQDIIETLLETIKHALESGEDVFISEFCKFCVKDKKERLGRNLATGASKMLAPRRLVTPQK